MLKGLAGDLSARASCSRCNPKEEFTFTNHALLKISSSNSTTTRKLTERFDYRNETITSVKFETAGLVDRDCEIKFKIGGKSVSIDVAKAEQADAQDFYKVLEMLSRRQIENNRAWEHGCLALKHSSEALYLTENSGQRSSSRPTKRPHGSGSSTSAPTRYAIANSSPEPSRNSNSSTRWSASRYKSSSAYNTTRRSDPNHRWRTSRPPAMASSPHISRSRSRSRSPTQSASRRSPVRTARKSSVSRSASRSASKTRSSADEKSPSRSKESPKSKPVTLRVENLTRNVNADHLREIFGKFGLVVRVDMAVPKGKASAIVAFAAQKDADNAKDHMHEAGWTATSCACCPTPQA
ncbi:Nucleotide-binding alpha-beta plait domain [Phytophthora cactorum]|nr:Nucleotide-binding alpha-beta plait domain [Phytophthora cactorum]